MKTTNKTSASLLENIARAERSEPRVGHRQEDIGRRTIFGQTTYSSDAFAADLAELEMAVSEGLATVTYRQIGRRWKLTPAGRAIVTDAVAQRAAHSQAIEAAGFDPDKPLSQMTPEEVAAFIAWNEEN